MGPLIHFRAIEVIELIGRAARRNEAQVSDLFGHFGKATMRFDSTASFCTTLLGIALVSHRPCQVFRSSCGWPRFPKGRNVRETPKLLPGDARQAFARVAPSAVHTEGFFADLQSWTGYPPGSVGQSEYQ